MTAANIALFVSLSHWVVGGFIFVALVSFLWGFMRPGWRVGNQLKGASAAMAALKKQGPVLDLDAVGQQCMLSAELQHCWTEYRDTLHPQNGISSTGEQVVARWRATASAGAFFSERVLVDIPLRSEFFKHLPGILTGLGIIGTFTGLIFGLMGFQVSDDPNAVRGSLQGLLNAVGGAFVVSGTAIGLAMLTTLFEKIVISRRYAETESLCGQIDGLYDSGAGEEYLARIVDASETSATQAQHIKEALVSDLKSILTDLAERQMNAVTASNLQLGQQISTAVTETLKAPLESISEAVKNVSGQQGDAVNKLLTDVLASFASRMESMFGGQLGGMNELLKQTAATMQGTAQQFESLALRIEQAGTGATDKMATRMEELLQTMGERQSESNAQMTAFMQQVRTMVNDGTSQSAELMQGAFTELSQVTGKLMAQLEQQTAQAHAELRSGSQAVADQMHTAVAQQQEHANALSEAIQQAAQTMQETVTRMRAGVDDNVARMSGAAERLDGAATKLSVSLTAMTNAANAVDEGIDGLTEASKVMGAAANANSQALAQHKEVRDAVTTMVTELRRLVETTARDASVNDRLVRQIESAAERLVAVQVETDKYLEGVTDTLAEAHQAFASTVTSTLQRGNADFHLELSRAIDLLRSAVQDLGDLFDGLPSGKKK
jgi:hypothetical protein